MIELKLDHIKEGQEKKYVPRRNNQKHINKR